MKLAFGLRVNSSQMFNEIHSATLSPMDSRPLRSDEKVHPDAHTSHQIRSDQIAELILDSLEAYIRSCDFELSERAWDQLTALRLKVGNEMRSARKK